MTYQEEKTGKVFNWREELNLDSLYKRHRMQIYEGSMQELVDKANIWVTCACGNKDHRIPRHPNGSPIDGEINYLGVRFAQLITAIRNYLYESSSIVLQSSIDSANDVLDKIDRRELELIAEIEASNLFGTFPPKEKH